VEDPTPPRHRRVGKYGTVENITAVEESGIRAYLRLHEAGGRGRDFFPKSAFTYDAEKDLYICPAGETLRALGDPQDIRSRGKVVTYRARGSVCAECSLKPRCTTNKNGRSLRRAPKDEYIDLVRTYMQTEPYQKAIRKRKVWIEPLFAEGKLWHGMRRFRMRTLEKVNTEALMMATGQNIKRLLSFGRRGPEKLAQAVALRPPVRLRLDIARRRFRDHRRERRVDPTLFNTLYRFRNTPLKAKRAARLLLRESSNAAPFSPRHIFISTAPRCCVAASWWPGGDNMDLSGRCGTESMQDTCYLYAIGREGFINRNLGRTHPTHGCWSGPTPTSTPTAAATTRRAPRGRKLNLSRKPLLGRRNKLWR
jgi:Transposase DDE domain